MSITSINQFREIVKGLVNDLDKTVKGRSTHIHESAELFNAVGNKIVGLDLKFYIEDDGGNWETDGILKPEFIWDMKKISGRAIIDDGNNTAHYPLEIVNAFETRDGLKFSRNNNSKLVSSEFNGTILNNKNININIWFNPLIPNVNYKGNLFNIASTNYYPIPFGDNVNPKDLKAIPNFSVNLNSNTDGSVTASLYYYESSSIKIISLPGVINSNSLNNIQVRFHGTGLSFLINGEFHHIDFGTTLYPNFTYNSNESLIFFEVGAEYYGEISYLSMNATSDSITNEMMQKMFLHKYPLPRNKELVDFSDKELNGLDVFISANDITKAIETVKGQYYVKSNEIKVRNNING